MFTFLLCPGSQYLKEKKYQMQVAASEFSNFIFLSQHHFLRSFSANVFHHLCSSQHTLESAYTSISCFSCRMTDWTIKRKESTAPQGHLIPCFLLKNFCSFSVFRLSGEDFLHEHRRSVHQLKQYQDTGDTLSIKQEFNTNQMQENLWALTVHFTATQGLAYR